MSDNISENIPEPIPEPILQPIPAAVPVTAEQAALADAGIKEPEAQSSSARSIFIAIAGWIIPGLGHLMQWRIGRAVAGFAAVGTMAVIGLWMRGNVFPAHSDDAFGLLGFIADAGSGIFICSRTAFRRAARMFRAPPGITARG